MGSISNVRYSMIMVAFFACGLGMMVVLVFIFIGVGIGAAIMVDF